MSERLPDFIVKQIASSGRCYPREGKSLAAEVLAHREAMAKDAAARAAQSQTPNPYGGIPYP